MSDATISTALREKAECFVDNIFDPSSYQKEVEALVQTNLPDEISQDTNIMGLIKDMALEIKTQSEPLVKEFLVNYYGTHYTETELSELIDLSNTPVFQKYLKAATSVEVIQGVSKITRNESEKALTNTVPKVISLMMEMNEDNIRAALREGTTAFSEGEDGSMTLLTSEDVKAMASDLKRLGIDPANF